jgi:hypothetical protein
VQCRGLVLSCFCYNIGKKSRPLGNCRQLEELGAPFAVDPASGAVLPAELDALRAREVAAAARRDFRLAARLADMAYVLTPRPAPLTLAECAPASAREQFEFYLEHGFCVVHGALSPHGP